MSYEPNSQPFPQQTALHTTAEHRAALLTQPGNIKEALRQAQEDPSKTLLGVAQGIPSTFVTKLLASTKPDFIWFDVEHAMFNRLELHDAIHAAQHHSEGRSMVAVRIPKHDETILSTALDAGAAAIIIPHVDHPSEVKRILDEVYYPPFGKRSFSPWTFTPGISDKSIYADDPWMMKQSNSHIAVIAQIESVEGLKNVEEIAQLEGVSGLMFGPGDYSADAGIDFRFGAPMPEKLLHAMGRMAEVSAKYKLPMFGGAFSPEQIPMMIQGGYRAIATTFDVWGLTGLVNENLTKARSFAVQSGKPQATEGTAVESNGAAKESNGTNGASNGTH